MAELDVAPVDELPPGSVKIVHAGAISVGVYNLDGALLRDRGSLLARRRPALRGRLRRRGGVRGLSAARRADRDLHRPAAVAAGRRARSRPFPSRVEDGMVKVVIA